MRKKILITGASGFIGSFLVEGALERGMQVWAGVRKGSSRKYLQDKRIHFVELDFAHSSCLAEQLEAEKWDHDGWDYIIHCAGVTKCKDKAEFDFGNYMSTRRLIMQLLYLDMLPSRFIYLSSLSVFGPIHEEDYSPICDSDVPRPNTAYGESKLKAEEFLRDFEGFPYVIFRPTGVYGPRERDYFLMAQSIAKHVDVAAGFRRQDLTFVYVKDLVQAVYLAIEKQVARRTYFVSDGGVYSSRTFSRLLQKELGNPWVVRFVFPLWLLKAVSSVAGYVAGKLGTTCTLNPDKYRIMKQRNWRCDIGPLEKELGYHAEYPLERGVKETVAWYKKEGWL